MTPLLLSVDAPPVAVVRAGGQFLLVAASAIDAGALLFDIHGDESDRPDQWSVQIGANTHIVVPAGVDLAAQLDHYPWRFMNHHCEPNTRIEGRQVIAIRAIAAGDEVTFNYNTTEWEMAAPFDCRCGSVHCGGFIAGYRHLGLPDRLRLGPIAWL